MDKIWEVIAKQGAFGLALAASLMIIMSMNDARTKEYEMRLEQSRQERQELTQVIKENTTASQQLADAIRQMLGRLK